ncbi:hypothetical protein D3C71_1010400 [compost metagenome]
MTAPSAITDVVTELSGIGAVAIYFTPLFFDLKYKAKFHVINHPYISTSNGCRP